jgi:hypothetical protein
MTNDFSQIDAQDEVSKLAQLTPEEIAEANSFYDELNAQNEEPQISPEGQDLNLRGWLMFETIHNEMAPKMATIRARDSILETV